jgi:hypothetical protein
MNLKYPPIDLPCPAWPIEPHRPPCCPHGHTDRILLHQRLEEVDSEEDAYGRELVRSGRYRQLEYGGRGPRRLNRIGHRAVLMVIQIEFSSINRFRFIRQILIIHNSPRSSSGKEECSAIETRAGCLRAQAPADGRFKPAPIRQIVS